MHVAAGLTRTGVCCSTEVPAPYESSLEEYEVAPQPATRSSVPAAGGFMPVAIGITDAALGVVRWTSIKSSRGAPWTGWRYSGWRS